MELGRYAFRNILCSIPWLSKSKFVGRLTVFVVLSLPWALGAQQVPHRFEKGKDYTAAEFNANFDFLAAELSRLRDELRRRDPIPSGAIVLMQLPCPTSGYQDMTEQYKGRFVIADPNVSGGPTTKDGDGSHTHTGKHDHSVNLRTSALGGGQRKGTESRDTTVPHENTRLTVVGKTDAEEISFSGGAHVHAAVGLRLCLKVN